MWTMGGLWADYGRTMGGLWADYWRTMAGLWPDYGRVQVNCDNPTWSVTVFQSYSLLPYSLMPYSLTHVDCDTASYHGS